MALVQLRRFAATPKGSALGADPGGVKHKVSAILVFCLLCVPRLTAADSGFLIRKQISEVRLTLVATDRDDRPLHHLSPTDIMVLEDGQPIPRFELRSAAELPLRVGIVLDLSDSTRKSWDTTRTSLARMLGEVMRSGDELVLFAFSNQIQLEHTVAKPEQLTNVLQEPATGGLTALYDTLFQACSRPIFADDHDPHRSALILFSDGEDDLSVHGLSDTIARAQRSGVVIYTLTTHHPKRTLPGDSVLRDLSASTGGRDFIVKDSLQMAQALSEINDELRSSYLLYYRVPQETGRRAYRRVHVTSTQSNGFRVRSRRGYYTAP
jgi:VWFA-related protein